jgi:hypothetical protein
MENNQQEVQLKEQTKLNLTFNQKGEFNIEVSGDLSPEIIEQIQAISDQSQYFRQKDDKLEIAKLNAQTKLDTTVVSFAFGLFLVSTLLVSNIVSYTVSSFRGDTNSTNQVQTVNNRK